MEVDDQWHTLVWQKEDEPPFGELSVPDIANLDEQDPPPIWQLDSSIYFDLGQDTGCWGGTPCDEDSTYPPTSVDFIRVWYNEIPPQGWSGYPAGLMVQNDSWDPLGSQVTAGEELTLGLRVGGIQGNPEVAVSVLRTESDNRGGTYIMTAGDPQGLTDGSWVFPLTEWPDGDLWTPPEEASSADFRVDLVFADPLEDDSDNLATYEVTILGQTCPPPTTNLR